jgi:hypothetical protein
MLLSLRYGFLFVHIPKTGGTSIRVALRRYKWRDPYRILLFFLSRLSSLSGHRLACKLPRHAKAIAAYEMLPRDLFQKLFKFAFVRNPWDLQVSSFHHIQRERPHLLKGTTEFESFLRMKLSRGRNYVYHFDVSNEPQSDYIVDMHRNVIVDFVGRYEHFDGDFEEVCKRIGIPRTGLPHKRQAGERSDYRKYYNDATAQLIADHFKSDIDMFGYSF